MKYSELDNKLKRRSHSIFKVILDKYSNKKDKILDVGCASGIIGQIRKSPSYTFGIEYNPDLAKLAKKNCKKVFQLDLNHFSKSTLGNIGKFKIIFFGDVLEHIMNPEGVIEECKALLEKDGLIVISLPNIAQLQYRVNLLSGKFDYRETGVLDRTHLHLYTHKTAEELIKRCDLKIEEFYPSGTVVSYVNILPRLFASQLIFVCSIAKKE